MGEPSIPREYPSSRLPCETVRRSFHRGRAADSEARCPARAAVGWEVTPKWTGRRRLCESTTKTKSSRNVAIGTTKKSVEAKSFTWFFRKVLQLCEGGFR